MADPKSDKKPFESLQLIRGSGFIFGCRVAGAMLTLVAQILLARWMGASQLGIYVLAFSWGLLLANAASLGFPSAAIRFVSLSLTRADFNYAQTFTRFAIRAILIAGGVIVIAGNALAWGILDTDSEMLIPITIALLTVPMLALLTFFGGVANGYSRFALSFLPNNVARPAIFCLLIIIAWLSGTQLHAISAMTLQAIAVVVVLIPTAFFLLALIRPQGGERQPTRDLEGWLRTAASLLIAAMFTGYFPEIVIILAGSFLPSDELALVHVSFRIAMLIAFGLSAVDAYTSPEIARRYASRQTAELRQIVNRATRLRFWASLAAVAVFALLGRWLLALFGPEFVAGYPLLMILACGQLAQGLVGPVVRLMSVSGHQDQLLPVFAVAMLLLVGLIAVLVPALGARGAAIAAAIDMTIWAIWMRQLVIRHVGVRPSIL